MLSSLSAIFMKCFTGDTLVATEDGDKRIDEIEVNDYVWAEDTVTGEQVLKRVSKVYVKETDHLIHIGTSTGEDIETTKNHPFYTEERGWVAASELEEGETLHTEDGNIVTVTYNHDEWLEEPVKVYNLEVEGLHTYYVTVDRVLVHNEYNKDELELPKTVKSAKGVEGDFSVNGYSYRIDTNKVAPGEGGFHLHIYRGNEEIAKITGRGGYVESHKGKALLSPSEMNKIVKKEINKLVTYIQKML